jgi:opacity protein-like surface antigen
MKKYLITIVLMAALASSASAQLTPQQQRMKDCNAQATGMTGSARKQFMSSCLSGGTAEAKKPHCVNGKRCSVSCIDKNEICHM